MRILTQELMNRLFEVTDSLEIDRESISVPLALEGDGQVRRLDGGSFEIVLPDTDDPTPFLAGLPERLRALLG